MTSHQCSIVTLSLDETIVTSSIIPNNKNRKNNKYELWSIQWAAYTTWQLKCNSMSGNNIKMSSECPTPIHQMVTRLWSVWPITQFLGCEEEVAIQDSITTVHVSAIHSEGMIDSRSVSSCAGTAAWGMVPVCYCHCHNLLIREETHMVENTFA